MEKTILVVGATGMLGRPVAYRLLLDGFKVRVLTHSPERAGLVFDDRFEIVEGDITKPETLEGAVDGCELVYLNLGSKFDQSKYEEIEVLGTANVVEAARSAGVKRVGMISGLWSDEPNTGYSFLDAKARAMAKLKDSGVPYTIYKCCWFFESLPLFIQSGKAVIIGKQINPLYWMAVGDYASMVSKGMNLPEAENRTFSIKGIERISISSALMKFCDIVLPNAKVSYIPLFLAKMGTFFSRKPQMKGLIEFMSYFDKVGDPGVNNEAERMLGPAVTTLEDWCRDYRNRLEAAAKKA